MFLTSNSTFHDKMDGRNYDGKYGDGCDDVDDKAATL
jgi:hypothetical protein